MSQYEGKSFEEIRFEDYSMGNKGDGSGNVVSTGFGFGSPTQVAAPATTFSGFGNQPAPAAFGSTAPATFGSPAPASFGATAPAPYGSSAPAPFGATAPATFGTPAPSSFGSPAPAAFGGGIFGSTPAQAPGGVFGTTPARSPGLTAGTPAPSLFGATAAPTTPGIFGATATAPAGGSLFGTPAPAPGGIFGTTPTPAPGGIFGAAPAPSQGFYGATPAPPPAFGTPATNTPGMFGAPAPYNPSAGMFAPQALTPYGTLAAPAAQPPTFTSPMGTSANIIPPAADAALQQQLAAVENQKKELEKLDVWRGKSPSNPATVPASLSGSHTMMKLSPYCESKISTYRASPMSTTKIRPRGFGDSTSIATPIKITASFGQGGNSLQNTTAIAATSAKRLIINAEAHTPKQSLRLRITNGNRSPKNGIDSTAPYLNGVSHLANRMEKSIESTSPLRTPEVIQSPALSSTTKTGASIGSGRKPTPDKAHEFYAQLVGSPKLTTGKEKIAPSMTTTSKFNWKPTLTKFGYETIPSIFEMNSMSEADLAALSGFTIKKDGVASVTWEGSVDVRGADLDSIISIEPQDVAVYEEYEITGKKPPTGEKLNRPAIITMYDTFPKKGGANAMALAKDKFAKKLEKTTLTMNATFVSYDKDEGIWMFKVPHFSRYGLFDEESDDELEDSQVQKKPNTYFITNVKPGENKENLLMLQTNASPTRFIVPIEDDYDEGENDMEGEMVTIDQPRDELVVFNSDQGNEMQSESLESLAKESYKAMFLSHEKVMKPVLVEDEREEYCAFVEEQWEDKDSSNVPIISLPSPEEIHESGFISICSKIRKKSEISKSSVDMGIRMNRSFRVGWRPDGSFLHLGQGFTLTQSRPQFSDRSIRKTIQLLDVHMKNAEKNKLEFSLSEPKATERAIQEMLDATKNHDESDNNLTMNHAFTLIMCLLQTREVEKINKSTDLAVPSGSNNLQYLVSLRTVGAFRRWLKEISISTSFEEIDSLKRSGKVYDAILLCMAAGNITQAASIASEFGHLQLAGILVSGSSSGHFIREQLLQWRETGAVSLIPQDLLRIYSILGGDFGIEEQLYKDGDMSCNWIKRISLLLFYGINENGGSYDLSSLIKKYEDDVVSGIAPKPEVLQDRNSTIVSRPKSLIYYLIHLCNAIVRGKEEKLRLSDVIQPLGHISSPHNFSGAFQLASILSGLKCCVPLSEIEQAQLLSGHVVQLISAGKWEYAVYILLCSVGKTSLRAWRLHQAKQIVLQHFGPENKKLREMLIEKIGVPSIWIQEGLAGRFANSGNTFSYVQEVRSYSMDLAREALERTLVPTTFFRSHEEVSKCLEFLRPFSITADTLSATIVQLYDLSQEIEEVSDQLTLGSETNIKSLSTRANLIEKNLIRFKSSLENVSHPSINETGEVFVPMQCFLADNLSGISYLKLQISALESGGSIWDNSITGQRELKKLALQLVSDTRMGSASIVKGSSLGGYF